jgi:hypothetical protein
MIPEHPDSKIRDPVEVLGEEDIVNGPEHPIPFLPNVFARFSKRLSRHPSRHHSIPVSRYLRFSNVSNMSIAHLNFFLVNHGGGGGLLSFELS